MANGTIHKEIARADRIRERQLPHQKASKNAIRNLREAIPGAQPYRDPMDSSEVSVERLGLRAKGIPPRALGFAIAVLAVAGAIVAIIKAWQ